MKKEIFSGAYLHNTLSNVACGISLVRFGQREAKGLALIQSSGCGKASQGNVEGHFPYTKYIYFTIVKAPFYLCFNVMDYCMKPMRGAMSDNLMSTLKLLE